MNLYRPGDRTRAVCTRCGSLVPTTVAPGDGRGAVKDAPASSCDDCGSVVDVPARGAPGVTAPREEGPLEAAPPPATRHEREERALHKRVLTTLGAKDAPEAIRIVLSVEGVEPVKDGRAILVGFLSGTPLVDLCEKHVTRLSGIRFAVHWTAKGIRDEMERRRVREAYPFWGDESILSRLSARTTNALRAAGLQTDAQVIEHLRGCDGVPLRGTDGVGKMTRRELLEAYGGLF